MKMTKRLLALLLAVAMVMVWVPTGVNAATTNSEGFIEIRTIEDLYNVRTNRSGKYILMNDIDLTKATAKGGDWDYMGNGWDPIGGGHVYSNGAFSGEFNGNGKKIIGMRIDLQTIPSGTGNTVYLGLFANITGKVYDLTMTGGSITVKKDLSYEVHSGSLAGTMTGTVQNVHNYNTVSLPLNSSSYDDHHAGGIVGYCGSKATISGCSNRAAVNSTGYRHNDYTGVTAGGIAGYVSSSTSISSCFNTGAITASNTCYSGGTYYSASAGGIGGYSYDTSSSIFDCYNTGTVSADGSYDGGICGYGSTIRRCYNTGSGAYYGIASNSSGSGNYYLSGTGNDSSNSISLTAAQMKLQSMYPAFDFTNTWIMDAESGYAYPQLRSNRQAVRTVKNLEWTTQPTKTAYAYGEALDLTGGVLTATMDNGTTKQIPLTEAMVTGYDPTAPGTQVLSVTYSDITLNYTVTVAEKVKVSIYTATDLYNIRQDMDGSYVLMNDIDLSADTAPGGAWDYDGRGWNPIGSGDVYGNTAFTGELDGNGYSITGLRIDVSTLPTGTGSSLYLGLFSNVSGSVHDLTLDGTITANISNVAKNVYAGSIAGYGSGQISNCRSLMTVDVASTYYTSANTNVYAGGLLGYGSSAVITDCVNNGTVSAQCGESYYYGTGTVSYDDMAYTGGIVGNSDNADTQILRCYNTAPITAKGQAAGSSGSSFYPYSYAAGLSNGTAAIADCYNAGTVQAISSNSNSYYYGYAYGIGGSTVLHCYNAGPVTGKTTANSHAITAGTATECYYLTGTATDAVGAVALNDTQMQLQSMYVGFDFDSTWLLNTTAEYYYPQLQNHPQNLSDRVTQVSILSWPEKTEYFLGEELVIDDCRVKVTYATGAAEELTVTDDMISGYNPNILGEQTVTVTRGSCTDTFTVTVKERPVLTALELVSSPVKNSFLVGTAFDFTGAQLKASYSDDTYKLVDITEDMTTGGDINHIGQQTITVNWEGSTVSFTVNVMPLGVYQLRLDAAPEKRSYLEGEELDLTGMVLTALINDGTEETVTTGYTVTGYDANLPGEQTVTVTYKGFDASFPVTVRAKTLVSLELRKGPDKTTYISGEEFDPTGLELVAAYDNGTTQLVTDYEVYGFSALPGTQNITLRYGGQSVSLQVTVELLVMESLVITALPVKLTYFQGDKLDATGLEVQVTYNNGTVETVTDYQLVGYSEEPGTHTVYVLYEGLVSSFQVTVQPLKVISLTLTLPTKQSYRVGEPLDTAGLTVTALYNNGKQALVTDYSIYGFDSSTAGAKLVTVTVEDVSRSFSVVVLDSSISGKVRSYGDAQKPVTLRLLQEDQVMKTMVSTDGTFRFNNITLGSYQLEISKEGHVTRIYEVVVSEGEATLSAELLLVGDITGDGQVNMGDVAKSYACARGTVTLKEDYLLLVADINGDGKRNVGDTSMLSKLVREVG